MFSNNRKKRTAGREQNVLTRSFPFQLVLVTPDLLNTFYQQTNFPNSSHCLSYPDNRWNSNSLNAMNVVSDHIRRIL